MAPALVVRGVAYGESDLVLQLLVRGRGRVSAFARGGRRSQKRFAGAVESFTLADAELVERTGSDLFDLRTLTLVDAHLGVRSDLGRLAHAGYGLEIARELTQERLANDGLFDLTVAFLGELSRTGAKSVLLRAFELEALAAAGLAPVLGQCTRCGRPLEDEREVAFDVGLGGTACPLCASSLALPLDGAAHRLLMALRATDLHVAAAADETHLPLEAVRRTLRAFLQHHVPHELKSRAFMRDVGAPL